MIRRDLGVLWAGDVLRKIESKLPSPREKKGAAPSLCQVRHFAFAEAR